MKRIGKRFFATSLFYGTAGIGLGLFMAITQDHSQMPTHAHIMVVGWLSFAIFGMFYLFLGEGVSPALARLHFWLAQISLLGLAIGLGLILSGRPQFEPVAAVASMGYAASFLIFVAIAFLRLQRLPAAG